MPIIANWPIRVDGVTHEIGSVVDGLTSEEQQDLVDKGLAAYPLTAQTPDSKQPDPPSKPTTLLDALTVLVKRMKKPELVAYGESAGVPGTDDSQTVDPIRKAILADAQENGVDLEAMTDEQLKGIVNIAGIADTATERDELIAAIDEHFGTAEDDEQL